MSVHHGLSFFGLPPDSVDLTPGESTDFLSF